MVASLVLAGVLGLTVAEAQTTTRAQVKQEVRVDLLGSIQDRLQARETELLNRLNNLVGRIDSILTRAKSRIDKLAAEGRDVTEARAKASAADTAISSAKTALNDLQTKLDGVVSSAQPRQAWQSVKGSVQATATAIKTARQAVVDLVKILVAQATPSATSTKSQ